MHISLKQDQILLFIRLCFGTNIKEFVLPLSFILFDLELYNLIGALVINTITHTYHIFLSM